MSSHPNRGLDQPRPSTNGRLHFSLSGTPGNLYLVQVSTNVLDWLNTSTVTNESGTTHYTDPETNRGGFKRYRARLLL